MGPPECAAAQDADEEDDVQNLELLESFLKSSLAQVFNRHRPWPFIVQASMFPLLMLGPAQE